LVQGGAGRAGATRLPARGPEPGDADGLVEVRGDGVKAPPWQIPGVLILPGTARKPGHARSRRQVSLYRENLASWRLGVLGGGVGWMVTGCRISPCGRSFALRGKGLAPLLAHSARPGGRYRFSPALQARPAPFATQLPGTAPTTILRRVIASTSSLRGRDPTA
jgi:hypothetical protein